MGEINGNFVTVHSHSISRFYLLSHNRI